MHYRPRQGLGRTAASVVLNYPHAHTGRRGGRSRNEVLDLSGQDCGEGHLSEGTIEGT